MFFLHRVNVLKAIEYYPEDLKKIAEDLTLLDDSMHDITATRFLNACKEYDNVAANNILEEAFRNYFKLSNYTRALEQYVKKFGINTNLEDLNPREMILEIANYKDEIIKKIDAQRNK